MTARSDTPAEMAPPPIGAPHRDGMPGLGGQRVFPHDALDLLIAALRDQGYRVIGPRSDGIAVVYDEITAAADLPAGWQDEAEGGRVRYHRTGSPALFATSQGVQGWKRHLFPPRQKLFSARRTDKGFELETAAAEEPPLAFLGVRACELRAIQLQDRVFGQDGGADPGYLGRRRGAFVITVECARAVSTCFCASAGTGPTPAPGYDIKLNELLPPDGPAVFLAEAGSEAGLAILARLPLRAASPAELAAAAAQAPAAAAAQSRRLEAEAAALLARNLESPRWKQVAERCLTCGNCTMVCPTCFCSTVEDVTDLSGDHAERWRVWDSCFSIDYSYIHGGPVRSEAFSRYRQWITHKLSSWHQQFGSSGCVGCGRCIAWCPVGIDITEEVRALRQAEEAQAEQDRPGQD